MINQSIFREYDIRGIAGKDLTPDLAFRIGRAYALLAKGRLGKTSAKIAIGRDCRLSGLELSRALAAGLVGSGLEVVDLGMVTTPMTYFSLFQAGFDGSIMVTGSHNPPNYNGFKICVGKGTLYGKDIQELKGLILSDTSPSQPLGRTLDSMDIASQYEKYLLAHVRLARPMKVVVDAGNGAAGPFAPAIYRKMGCEVIELFCEPDGSFPNHEADPTVEKNLQDLIAAVKKHGADAGIAFDGDADRIGVVDE